MQNEFKKKSRCWYFVLKEIILVIAFSNEKRKNGTCLDNTCIKSINHRS